MGDNITPTESWNMAQATLKRLSGLLDMCSIYAQQGDLSNWFRVLMDLRRNLSAFLEDKDFNEVTTKIASLPKGWLMGSGKVNPQHYQAVNKAFDEAYIICYRCMKAKGLLMPKQVDTTKSIIDMS